MAKTTTSSKPQTASKSPAPPKTTAPKTTAAQPQSPTKKPVAATVKKPKPTTSKAAPAKKTTAAAPKPKPKAKSNPKAKLSAFGDSVMLGAAPALKAAVGSMTLDAVVGRQAKGTLNDVTAAQKAGALAPIVVIHTGTNGIVPPNQLSSTLKSLKDRAKVILINDHVDRAWQNPNNKTISRVGGQFGNVTVIDWNAAAKKNPGWFGGDGIHVNTAGARAYASLVMSAIG